MTEQSSAYRYPWQVRRPEPTVSASTPKQTSQGPLLAPLEGAKESGPPPVAGEVPSEEDMLSQSPEKEVVASNGDLEELEKSLIDMQRVRASYIHPTNLRSPPGAHRNDYLY